ncbi:MULTISPECIES: mechanosensitive ion channel domain-containing protein [unclassified Guyparkeria]|uniref:mechanosensitive ion channel family protein n=1 Tax=unclassified Guyparkeria TaxID=2626246 RepID=UPI0007338295|nr:MULTISPECIES: mechanosensitive ion channel domain-containing protein [unclassified Guyparkeria]KTG17674.1 mechanosensitive ion channel protein MscS [Guyparkeria sp. XI15]OAE88487.1 mechanosensitive ion channel protein MscS [Guyparkeria sp. WRN-7]
MEASFFSIYVLPWIIKIIFAAAIAVGGWYIAKLATPWLTRLLQRTGLDNMLVGFTVAIARAAFLLFVAIAALSKLGLDTTSLVALVAGAGLAIGLALKDSLNNFAAGVMILTFRPFRSGDFIITGGLMGTVNEIGIFHTRMNTPDNVEMIVPNGNLYSAAITNYSVRDTRRLELAIGIDYADDIAKAKELVMQVFEKDDRVLKDPAPVILVNQFGASSVDLLIRPWVRSADMPTIKSDLQQQIKETFDANGITIPFPQMVITSAATDEKTPKT